MKFLSNKPKINISTRNFYLLMAAMLMMTLTNAVFLGLSMTTKSLLQDVVKYQESYDTIKWKLIGNYIAFSSVLAIFAIHTLLARRALKIGYIYTNVWNVLVSAVIAIPIVMQPDFSDFRIWINLCLFIFYLIAMFSVYKEIFEVRRMKGYWVNNNGGMEW